MDLGPRMLELAADSSTTVRDNLKLHGDRPLAVFLGSLPSAPDTALQPREDFLSAVRDQAVELYDRETAEAAVAALMANPIVPTSNHFGVDTFADSVQGTLLFSLRAGTPPVNTVVVLGFGSISLNNLTYPMGLRLYDPRHGDLGALPQRLPILPNRVKQCAVSAAAPFDLPMVERARVRLRAMGAAGEVTPFCERAAGEILDRDFAAEATLSLPSYGHQSARINSALWRSLFRDRDSASRLVQLPIEPICAELLGRDFYDSASLTNALFFTKPLRDTLLSTLDGSKGCWRLDALGQVPPGAPGGTVFFWALTDSGRRVPLALRGTGRELSLAGTDATGREWNWEFTPDGIAAGLRDGRLLPSLFTCFLVLAFARGVRCLGGYYQASYLPAMRRGILAALAVGAEFLAAFRQVAGVPVDLCLAGMQAVGRVLDDGRVIPAGPVEIAGAGGLTSEDLAATQTVSVRDSYLLAFTETFPHLAPGATLPNDWVSLLAGENAGRGVRLEPT